MARHVFIWDSQALFLVSFFTDQNGNLNIFLIIKIHISSFHWKYCKYNVNDLQNSFLSSAPVHNILFTSLDHEIHFNTISFYFLFHLVLQYDLFILFSEEKRTKKKWNFLKENIIFELTDVQFNSSSSSKLFELMYLSTLQKSKKKDTKHKVFTINERCLVISTQSKPWKEKETYT